MRGVAKVVVVVGVLLGVLAPVASAAPAIQAHRGGSVLNGTPTYPENTLPAFAHAAANGWTIELDVTRTKDGMVVIHDPTLDRTTACSGPVRARTTAQLAACPSDVLGSPGSGSGGGVVAGTAVALPRLEQVFALARQAGARLSVEIKNVPTEEDFDPLMGLAFRVADALKRSGLPRHQVVVQSFWPPSLDVVELLAPGYPTAFLTLGALNGTGPLLALLRGYEWISPQWPVDQATIHLAHLFGKRVAPYTLDTAATVKAAARAGVDAVITDDPPMAQAALAG
ncbi:glycerophosphodiester phosphodiesterase [Conexibacter sp. SYSU D00693]|uniref:glycerophosphodiester phosphodiesterase n=1 Tax=Conexibacter sp. SYSU D00693 TaxID=2812560 RepID=UPI00196AC317|nr:glycerophosphodiester phosphodiesterase [Conexibacter sp. SYSU D00693]